MVDARVGGRGRHQPREEPVHDRLARHRHAGEFVECFTSEGFGWGGNWRSVKDAMHFSLAPNEGGRPKPHDFDRALQQAAIELWMERHGGVNPEIGVGPTPKKPGQEGADRSRATIWTASAFARKEDDNVRLFQERLAERGWNIEADRQVQPGDRADRPGVPAREAALRRRRRRQEHLAPDLGSGHHVELPQGVTLRAWPPSPSPACAAFAAPAPLRSLVRETRLDLGDFVYPMFVCAGRGRRRAAAPACPGSRGARSTSSSTRPRALHGLGVDAVLLFGIPEEKDDAGSGAYDEDGIVQQALRALRDAAPGPRRS